MKILVTGSNGQLGSAIRLKAKNYPALSFTFTDVKELDLTDFSAVNSFLTSHNFDYCVNCAGYTAVDKAEDEPEKAFLLNAGAVENLAQQCTAHQVRLIHISTDYVFDGNAQKPYTEDDPVSPQSVYGLSKLKGEQAVMRNAKDAIIIRTAWLCSAYGHNFVKTILRLAGEKSEVSVVDDQLGSPTFADDLAETLLMITGSPYKKTDNQIYHFSNKGVISWYIFAKKIVEMSGLSCTVLPVKTSAYPTKAKRPAYSVLDTGKIQNDFRIQIPEWEISLEKLINQLKKNIT